MSQTVLLLDVAAVTLSFIIGAALVVRENRLAQAPVRVFGKRNIRRR